MDKSYTQKHLNGISLATRDPGGATPHTASELTALGGDSIFSVPCVFLIESTQSSSFKFIFSSIFILFTILKKDLIKRFLFLFL